MSDKPEISLLEELSKKQTLENKDMKLLSELAKKNGDDVWRFSDYVLDGTGVYQNKELQQKYFKLSIDVLKSLINAGKKSQKPFFSLYENTRF